MDINQILQSEFIAEELSEDKLREVGFKVVEWFEEDSASRTEWENQYRQWIKLASQVMEEKMHPWPNAANIKYPAVTNAALQFNSRVVPALTPNAEPVGAKPIGDDPDGSRAQVARKIAKHMNYQLTSEIEEWEDDFDKLTMTMAITGQEYKKTYYSYTKRRIVSEYVPASELVIHYWYNDFESTRKTQKIPHTYNDLREMMNLRQYLYYEEDELGTPSNSIAEADALRHESDERAGYKPTKRDEASPHMVIEHHGWYDLDEDGYAEPYRIVVHLESKKVLAIHRRFTSEQIHWTEDNMVAKIDPLESYTVFSMIPNPDGSNYAIGFGNLIAPLNHTINTTINQLLDAGTLSNMQAGFIGKGVKLKGGVYKVTPGRFEIVPSAGGDLRNNIVPLPIKEPSTVLLSLLQFMVAAAKELSATTDIFTGQHPGQNTKAGVTAAVREEGLKVFNAIYKRLRRSFKREMMKIFRLNYIVLSSGLDSQVAQSAMLFNIQPEFYDVRSLAIEPSADPNIAIKEQRIQKAMGVLHLGAQFGQINMQVAMQRVLDAMEVDGIEELMQMPPPQPNPEVEFKKAELQVDMAEKQKQLELEERKIMMDSFLKLYELRVKEAVEETGKTVDMLKIASDIDKAVLNVQSKQRDGSSQ